MSALDSLIPRPRLREIGRVDLAAEPGRVWEHVRHGALAQQPLARALFAIRTLISRERAGSRPPGEVRLDDMTSSAHHPGFQVLVDDAPHEVAIGAIGQVWRLAIPFVHVGGPVAFAAFAAPDYVKVAWALRVSPRAAGGTHLEIEIRVDATSDAAWRRFQRYFRVIGPASRYIRRSLLRALARELGAPVDHLEEERLPGDIRLPDADAQVTLAIDIGAAPEAIWPWLIQMGCGRGGFYSIDRLDNGGRPSAREIHPSWQTLGVGDVVPASPGSRDGFEVLAIARHQALVLGGLYDLGTTRQLPFATARPARYWHVTWTFALQPLDASSTRLVTRARAAFAPELRTRVRWLRAVHHVMERAQLRRLAARAENRTPRDDWRDVAEGIAGAWRMALRLSAPFLREGRRHWGVDAATAARELPGDDLVATPRWSWTHGVEIEASAAEVWPWVAQVGADRAGFYSYQWLENLAGCQVRNAERVHPEWEVKPGDGLRLHPNLPPLSVVSLERGRYFLAHAAADAAARAAGQPWIEASWLFLVEPMGASRCRFVSRYRAACSEDRATRLAFGPTFLEPIAAEMDRRMLIGVRERVERARADTMLAS